MCKRDDDLDAPLEKVRLEKDLFIGKHHVTGTGVNKNGIPVIYIVKDGIFYSVMRETAERFLDLAWLT